jgi:hypothetical protein
MSNNININELDRQTLASQAVDLALEALVSRLEKVKAGEAELTPALLTATLNAAKALHVDLESNGAATSPVRDHIMESLKDLDLDDLMRQ